MIFVCISMGNSFRGPSPEVSWDSRSTNENVSRWRRRCTICATPFEKVLKVVGGALVSRASSDGHEADIPIVLWDVGRYTILDSGNQETPEPDDEHR